MLDSRPISGYNLPPGCFEHDIEVGEQCSGCRLYETKDDFTECSYIAYGDIAARIRKLAAKEC